MVGVILLRVRPEREQLLRNALSSSSSANNSTQWQGQYVEVLLQRRSKDVSRPFQYCMPCGSMSRGEYAVAADPARSDEDRKLAMWHGALRELMEEAGGGTCGIRMLGIAQNASQYRPPLYPSGGYPPDPDWSAQPHAQPHSEGSNILLPEKVLREPRADTHFWLGACDTCSEDLHVGRGECFCCVLATCLGDDAVWCSGENENNDSWRPRGLPKWRWEMDEGYNKHGLRHGYVWVELEHVLQNTWTPVPGSSMPLVGFAAPLFLAEGKSRLLSCVRQSFGSTAEVSSAASCRISSLQPLCMPPRWENLTVGGSVPRVFPPHGRIYYVMRHGESAANAANSPATSDANDYRDAQLTQLGVEQAAAWRVAVTTWNVRRILVSPLKRALQTAAVAFVLVGNSHSDPGEAVELAACRSLREIGWHRPENWGTVWKTDVNARQQTLPAQSSSMGLFDWLQQPQVFGLGSGYDISNVESGRRPSRGPRLVEASFAKLQQQHEMWNPEVEPLLLVNKTELERRETQCADYAINWLRSEAVGQRDCVAVVTHFCFIQKWLSRHTRNCGVWRVVCEQDGSIRCLESVGIS